jgi:hypothetical protein
MRKRFVELYHTAIRLEHICFNLAADLFDLSRAICAMLSAMTARYDRAFARHGYKLFQPEPFCGAL